MSKAFSALALIALSSLPLTAQCAPTPLDPSAAPQAIGLVLNGRSFNGVQFNGLRLNGVNFNGINFNGRTFNGLQFNGFTLNGRLFNGISLNGVGFNGFTLNGKLFNGMPFDGTLSRRGFVGVFEARSAANAETSWSSLALADVRVRLPLAR